MGYSLEPDRRGLVCAELIPDETTAIYVLLGNVYSASGQFTTFESRAEPAHFSIPLVLPVIIPSERTMGGTFGKGVEVASE